MSAVTRPSARRARTAETRLPILPRPAAAAAEVDDASVLDIWRTDLHHCNVHIPVPFSFIRHVHVPMTLVFSALRSFHAIVLHPVPLSNVVTLLSSICSGSHSIVQAIRRTRSKPVSQPLRRDPTNFCAFVELYIIRFPLSSTEVRTLRLDRCSVQLYSFTDKVYISLSIFLMSVGNMQATAGLWFSSVNGSHKCLTKLVTHVL